MNATQLSKITEAIHRKLDDWFDYEINPHGPSNVAHVYVEDEDFEDITVLIRDGHALNADLCVNVAYDADYLRDCLDSIVEQAWLDKRDEEFKKEFAAYAY